MERGSFRDSDCDLVWTVGSLGLIHACNSQRPMPYLSILVWPGFWFHCARTVGSNTPKLEKMTEPSASLGGTFWSSPPVVGSNSTVTHFTTTLLHYSYLHTNTYNLH